VDREGDGDITWRSRHELGQPIKLFPPIPGAFRVVTVASRLVPPRCHRRVQHCLKVQAYGHSRTPIEHPTLLAYPAMGLNGLARPTQAPVAGLHALRLSLGGLALTLKPNSTIFLI
jgi:hypothetical protein